MSAATTAVAVPLADERANSLFRWNAVLSGLHGIQGLIRRRDRRWG